MLAQVMEEAMAITEVTTVTMMEGQMSIFLEAIMTEAAMCRLIVIVDL